MSSYAFLVCHRTVDLVAATAEATLRDALGLGDRLVALRRDDAVALEDCQGESEAWARACADHAAWFNPNTHRHAFFAAREGAVGVVGELALSGREAPPRGVEWPLPWLGRLLHTDRADLLHSSLAGPPDSTDLLAWQGLPSAAGAFSVTLAAFDAEDPVHDLQGRAWPVPGARVLLLQLWTLALLAGSAEEAEEMALEVALTRRRKQGLLIHPQVQGWALAAPVSALLEEST